MENLPADLIFLLISFLDDKAKRIMRLANTLWFNNILCDDFIFYQTTAKQLPQILDRLAKYSFPIGVRFKNQCFSWKKDNCKAIGNLTQLTKLYAQFGASNKRLHPLTNLTNLKLLGHGLSMEFMQHFTGLRKLHIDSHLAHMLDLPRFTKLESVKLSPNPYNIEDPLIMLHNATNLTCLHAPIQMDENRLTRFTKLKKLVLSPPDERKVNIPCLPYLETLHVDSNDIGNLSSFQNTLTSLTWAKLDTPDFLLLLPALSCLKNLSLDWSTDDDITALDLHFLTALSNLEYLHINPTAEFEDWSKALEFIRSDKLRALSIHGCVDMPSISILITKLCSLCLYRISGGTEAIPNLKNLTSLKYFDCSIESLKLIESMTNLKYMEVSLRLENPSMFPLSKMTRLEELTQYGTKIDSEHLKHLPLLKRLNCYLIDDKFWENIASVTSLKEIQVTKAQNLTDDSIRWLTGLTNLAIFSCNSPSEEFTGTTLTLLTSLHTLDIFNFSNDKFIYSKVSVKNSLVQKLTRLVHFNT